jgi:hypothetical protein
LYQKSKWCLPWLILEKSCVLSISQIPSREKRVSRQGKGKGGIGAAGLAPQRQLSRPAAFSVIWAREQ